MTTQRYAKQQQMVLMFTDIVDSVQTRNRIGAEAYQELRIRHNRIIKDAVAAEDGAVVIKNLGDGYLIRFANTAEAVRTALRAQYYLTTEEWGETKIAIRTGIHSGMALEVREEGGAADVQGLSVDLTARLMGLGSPGQILLSRSVFDDARQFVRKHPIEVSKSDGVSKVEMEWRAHGPYLLKGTEQSVEVYEVGAVGIAPLAPPPDSEKAKRSVAAGEEQIYDWRPAAGMVVPPRPDWELEKKIGAGGFGEVWLAKHRTILERRVFKFCFDVEKLNSLKRELAFFKLLREALGERSDIAKIYEVRTDKPPFFLESEYSAGGDLYEWAAKRGGIGTMPLQARLDLMRRIAEAVAAAHSVGVLHKDLKPANILMDLTDEANPRPKLADFGIGVLDDMAPPGVTEPHAAIMKTTATTGVDYGSGRAGTQMYSPPESYTFVKTANGGTAPSPFTARGDVYALGVMLFQTVIGDFDKPIGEGWRDSVAHAVDDPLLRELLLMDIAEMVAADPEARMASATDSARRLATINQRRAELERQKENERLAALAIENERLAKIRTKRNRIILAASVVVFIGLLVAASIIGAREARLKVAAERERDDARVARTQASVERRKAEIRSTFATARAYADSNPLLSALLIRALPESLPELQFDAIHATLAERNLPAVVLQATKSGTLKAASWCDDTGDLCAIDETGVVQFWDPVRQEKLWANPFAGPIGASDRVRPTADGSRLLATLASGGGYVLRLQGNQAGNPIPFPGVSVSAMDVSQDGRWAALGGTLGQIRIVDLESGTSRDVPPESAYADALRIRSVAFHPTAAIAAVATGDGQLLVIDVDELFQQPELPRDVEVARPDVEPASAPLPTASTPRRTYLKKVFEVTNQGHLLNVSFRPDGRSLALQFGRVTYLMNRIALMPVTEPSETRPITFGPAAELAYITAGFRTAVWSHDSAWIAAPCLDGTLRLWDSRANPPALRTLPLGGQGLVASFDPRSQRVAAASTTGTIKLWDLDFRTEPRQFSGHQGQIESLSWKRDGRALASASRDGTLCVWSMDFRGEPVLYRNKSTLVSSFGFAPGTPVLHAGHEDGSLFFHDLSLIGSSPRSERHGNQAILHSEYSRDGARFLTASQDGFVRVRGVADRAFAPEFEHRTAAGEAGKLEVVHASFSPDGTHFASVVQGRSRANANQIGYLAVWNLEDTKAPVRRVPMPGAGLTPRSVSWSFDGQKLLVPIRGFGALVVDAHSTADPIEVRRQGSGAAVGSWHPSELKFALTESGGVCTIVSAAGDTLATPVAASGNLTTATWSHDGKHFATVSRDGFVRIYAPDGSGEPRKLLGNDSNKHWGVFSPNSDRFFAYTTDGNGVVWDLESAASPVVLPGVRVMGDSEVTSSSPRNVWSKDQTLVGIGSTDGSLRVWHVTWAALRLHLWAVTDEVLSVEQRMEYLNEPEGEAIEKHARDLEYVLARRTDPNREPPEDFPPVKENGADGAAESGETPKHAAKGSGEG